MRSSVVKATLGSVERASCGTAEGNFTQQCAPASVYDDGATTRARHGEVEKERGSRENEGCDECTAKESRRAETIVSQLVGEALKPMSLRVKDPAARSMTSY